MAHFCWFIKLLFLLLMMSKPPTRDARPLRGTEESSDLIAGNEFLKLFLGRDELHRALRSSENPGRGGSGGVADAVMEDEESEAGSRHPGPGARSLDHKSRGSNAYTYASGTDSKQVVKLVTSGSKIVFLEEYDDDDAVVDAVARDIDLQKERRPPPVRQEQQRHQGDEVKVVAVSVSSSSKRSGHVRERPSAEPRGGNFPEKALLKHGSGSATTTTTPGRQWQPKPHFDHHKSQRPAVTTSSISPPTLTTVRFPPTPATTRTTTARVTTTTTTTTARATTTTKSKSLTKSTATATSTTTAPPSDFINRSHKSEFSIEEVEPLMMAQRPASSASSSSGIGSFYDTDSENSASTNIQNVLAAPLVRTPPTPPADGNDDDDDASTPGTYRGGSRNATRINQAPPPASSARSRVTHADSHMPAASAPQTSTSTSSSSSSSSSSSTSGAAAAAAAGTEDKLLPFQTVIYHDTKEGHGPQSRSISYSSISQNVEDLQTWQRSGILAEAQRNVSESLKPVPRSAGAAAPAAAGGQSEPAKFYSMPAKMYSVPSKFYSEPAKVYSEPAKVYGQPEKFYSEPAKVYGQPAKFYSEPAKVYSQPAKVYGEPAKTYWPRPSGAGAGATAATTMTTTTTTTTTPRAITTSTTDFPLDGTTTPAAPFAPRRPAIVSRIAFGEAQTTTTPVDPETSHYHRQSPGPHQGSQHHHHHHHHHHQQHHHQQQHHPYHGNAPSQPRRILFNLDKLPYDLLNAPEQSPKNLLEPDSSKHGTPTSAGRQRPCWEPPSSASSSSTSSTSQQQQQRRQQMQQQQHHSSLLDQHSNQNAKGLPNRDLVKCVSKYSHSSGGGAGGGSGGSSARRPPSSYTTEGSHIEELYSPTPEQNYEIEESVSVMTNGRAHGVQGVATTTTTAAPARSRTRGGGGGAGAGGGSISSSGLGLNPGSAAHFGTNANANADDADDAEEATEDNYDDEDDDDSGGRHHSHGSGGGGGNGEHGDDDDSKVAYVVEGRNYRKYRVEEKTDDGFIVGEYGVVDHNDGNLRGVRYTADSTINRSLIQKALLTFLKLK